MFSNRQLSYENIENAYAQGFDAGKSSFGRPTKNAYNFSASGGKRGPQSVKDAGIDTVSLIQMGLDGGKELDNERRFKGWKAYSDAMEETASRADYRALVGKEQDSRFRSSSEGLRGLMGMYSHGYA